MWSTEGVPSSEPLRQGDVIVDVIFPALRLPLNFLRVENLDQTAMKANKQVGLVVSQCCDNVAGDYVAVAPVGLRGGMKEHQLRALLEDEPHWDGNRLSEFNVSHFRLLPHGEALAVPMEGKHWVANLDRTACFYGDCTGFQEKRVARMTVEGRRLLRIKLGLLWSRVEEEDASELEAKGLPVGLTPSEAMESASSGPPATPWTRFWRRIRQSDGR